MKCYKKKLYKWHTIYFVEYSKSEQGVSKPSTSKNMDGMALGI